MKLELTIEKDRTKYTVARDLVDLLARNRLFINKFWQKVVSEILQLPKK